ncbi:ABC transporter substrate-binding protein [Polyangium jinanense]|uniref:ABC transporter substrate-binding protein n=1 Tax=Polyangium jinanense TaxID=2829994 RepID=A0A9X4AQJ1_9BACT|nr:ABC transporter substrate-binding protein [Polyangium jinanense]MDC3955076.1 ABC transporter substrate-binding protein [Polyangium jinanense]MDC3981154.1 ABC transporter substrate-binding protein [Polyangium jinanense]
MIRLSSWVSAAGLAVLGIAALGCGRPGEQKPEGAAPTGSAAPAAQKPADPAQKFKGQTLNILAWEGYADAKFTKGFEEKYGVTVKGTYFGSSDELVAKLKSSPGVYDIVSPSSDVAYTLMQGGLVDPIDTSKISSWGDLADALKNLDDVKKDGKLYGVPFTWGPDYLIYDANVVKEEPKSWKVFYDAQYKGKVTLWDDISNIYLVGQIMGLDKSNPAALYNMTDEQLAEAKKKLVELKPQVRKYWATAGELNDLFKNKEVVLAVGWPLTVGTLNKEGLNLKGVIPEEGATGWIDRLMITSSSKNKELALAYLDYVTTPKAQALVFEATGGYCVANAKAKEHMSEDLKKSPCVTEGETYFKRLNFWQYVKERKKYNELWNEVKSAK